VAELGSRLSYEVLVSDGVPRKIDLRMPNGEEIVSSPISSTLIYGERDAVLVDPPLTNGQIAQVADGVARSGKQLALSRPATPTRTTPPPYMCPRSASSSPAMWPITVSIR
jgi:hypothetical protein